MKFFEEFSSGAVGGRDYFSGYTDIFLYEAQQQTVNDWRKNEQTEYTNKLREMDRRLESTGLIFIQGIQRQM